MKKNELTRQGFLDLNLMEANDRDGDPWDLWVTLLSLGYNKTLEMTEVREPQSKNPCTLNCCMLCVCHKVIAGTHCHSHCPDSWDITWNFEKKSFSFALEKARILWGYRGRSFGLYL